MRKNDTSLPASPKENSTVSANSKPPNGELRSHWKTVISPPFSFAMSVEIEFPNRDSGYNPQPRCVVSARVAKKDKRGETSDLLREGICGNILGHKTYWKVMTIE
jgi:hypothetical protein